MATAKADPSAAKHFLKFRYGDRPVQVVYSEDWKGEEVAPEGIDALLERVGDSRFYFAPCNLRPHWGDTTPSLGDAVDSNFIWFDFDAKKYGKPETPYDWKSNRHYQQENERIANALQGAWARLKIKPSASWNTSAGVQGLLRLDRAISPEQACALGKKLAVAIGADTTVYNENRILRVPGSVNPKTTNGRRPTEVSAGRFNDVTYTVEQLEAALGDVVVPPSASSTRTKITIDRAAAHDLVNTFSIDDLRKRGVNDDALALLEEGDVEGKYKHKSGNSDMLLFIAGACIRADLTPEETAGVLGTRKFPGCIHAHGKGDNWRKVKRTIEKAMSDEDAKQKFAKRTAEVSAVIEYDESQLDKLLHATQNAMLAAKLPIYQRSARLVYPYRLAVDTVSIGSKREAGTMVIEAVVPAGLRVAMTKAALFTKWVKGVEKPIAPPIEFANAFLAWKPEWKFPVLRGISDVPILRDDGTVCSVEGYDKQSMMLLDFGGATYALPDNPTREDALAAIGVLDEVLKGFPFDAKPLLTKCQSRSVALSLFLSCLISQTIDAVPAHLFVAPAAGTGKTLLIQSAGIMATGRLPPAMSYTGREEEDEKRLVGAFMAGGPLILLDNIKKGTQLSGDFLCSSITGPSTLCRRLGFTGQSEVPTNTVIAASGNNIGVEGDMGRRSLRSVIDAEMEQPEMRRFDVDLWHHCREHRAELVQACLTIMRAFIVSPDRLTVLKEYPALGSFGQWSTLVRAPLIWLGEVDPVKSMDEMRGVNPETAALGDLMHAWKACEALPEGEWVSIGDVIDASKSDLHPILTDALDRLFPSPRRPSTDGLGRYLHKFLNTVVTIGGVRHRFEHQRAADGRGSQYRLLALLAIEPKVPEQTGFDLSGGA